ncbi:hypothetical protein C5S32_09215 [ANME-1 cluster archaeon GoMg1]|nr:hypothetical protein [ANME-1 cluster archaeon GoMg1]
MNAAEVLEKELSSPRWKGDSVNLGSVCDPYQPAEKKFMPIFSYLTDDFENINGVVKAVSDAGAKDLVAGVLDLRASCRKSLIWRKNNVFKSRGYYAIKGDKNDLNED